MVLQNNMELHEADPVMYDSFQQGGVLTKKIRSIHT
jgi:hypothetical protein